MVSDNGTDDPVSQGKFELLVIEKVVEELCFLWKFYCDLFTESHSISKMVSISSSGFLYIDRALIYNIVRLICVLTDGAGSGSRKNLVLSRVCQTLRDEIADTRGVSELDKADATLALAVHLTEKSVKPYRDKLLMHNDYTIAMGAVSAKPSVPFEDIKHIVKWIFEAVNYLQGAAFDSGVGYDTPIDRSSGEFEWMLYDHSRILRLRKLANTNIRADALKELLKQRSAHSDSSIVDLFKLDKRYSQILFED